MDRRKRLCAPMRHDSQKVKQSEHNNAIMGEAGTWEDANLIPKVSRENNEKTNLTKKETFSLEEEKICPF